MLPAVDTPVRGKSSGTMRPDVRAASLLSGFAVIAHRVAARGRAALTLAAVSPDIDIRYGTLRSGGRDAGARPSARSLGSRRP